MIARSNDRRSETAVETLPAAHSITSDLSGYLLWRRRELRVRIMLEMLELCKISGPCESTAASGQNGHVMTKSWPTSYLSTGPRADNSPAEARAVSSIVPPDKRTPYIIARPKPFTTYQVQAQIGFDNVPRSKCIRRPRTCKLQSALTDWL